MILDEANDLEDNQPCSFCEINCGRDWCFTNREVGDEET